MTNLNKHPGRSVTDRLRAGSFRYVAFLLIFANFHPAWCQRPSGWKLAWSDEFDGPIGSAPDPSKWKLQSGPGAAIAGNDEAEFYCARDTSTPPCKPNQPNSYLDGNGHLVIVAVRTDNTVIVGANKVVSPVYTSARLITVPAFRYGRIEASIRIPAAGHGVWPAFWALGKESAGVHWPAIGEIDIMEQWNPLPSTGKVDGLTIYGSTHGPVSPGSGKGFLDQTASYVFPGEPSNGLHQYAVDWVPGEVDFYVDGYLYERSSVGSLNGQDVWEQDRGPFSLLLNLAMGGGFFGYPDASTGPTPTMVVDYVRVYQPDGHALPAEWSNADVGGPSEAGQSVFENGVYKVAGGGFGISGHFDQFQFAYKSLAGDGEVTAHVLDQTSKVAQAKAGVMLREGRGAASPFAMAFLSPDGSVHFRFRKVRGDVPGEVIYKGSASWLKVGRLGDIFTAYGSVDGKSWTAFGDAKLILAHDLLAGLISTARDNKVPNLARFDYVNVTPSDAAFDGEAVAIPGVVQAERFDTGGTGYSFSTEFGEAGPTIRKIPDATDLDASASGYFLTGIRAGRYINYSVNISREGDYKISLRAASAGGGGTVHFNLDQKPLSKPFSLPDTGGGDRWREIESPTVHMAAGPHTLAFVTDSAGASGSISNIDLFRISLQ